MVYLGYIFQLCYGVIQLLFKGFQTLFGGGGGGGGGETTPPLVFASDCWPRVCLCATLMK